MGQIYIYAVTGFLGKIQVLGTRISDFFARSLLRIFLVSGSLLIISIPNKKRRNYEEAWTPRRQKVSSGLTSKTNNGKRT